MKISENTLTILKNFATINAGILIKAETKQLKTKAIANNIFAYADIEEEFPVDVPIYDLNEFLNVMSLFVEPEFDFDVGSVTIKDNKNKRTKVVYRYASKDLIAYPEKDVSAGKCDVEFDLSKASISSFNKAASMLVVEDVALTNMSEREVITLKVLDNKNSASNVFEIEVGKTEAAADFDFHFKAENLKMIPADYKTGINAKGISVFENKDLKIKYFIAIEASSSYTADEA